MRLTRYAIILALLALVVLLGACGAGDSIALDQRATRFTGGALSNFSGVDGDVAAARATARDIAIARDFDFTPVGFNITAGTASTGGAGASLRFGDGLGTITISEDIVFVDIDVTSLDPSVTNVTLDGTFSLSAAQAALADAGASFTVVWQFNFSEGISTYSVEADQVLSGSNWVDV